LLPPIVIPKRSEESAFGPIQRFLSFRCTFVTAACPERSRMGGKSLCSAPRPPQRQPRRGNSSPTRNALRSGVERSDKMNSAAGAAENSPVRCEASAGMAVKEQSPQGTADEAINAPDPGGSNKRAHLLADMSNAFSSCAHRLLTVKYFPIYQTTTENLSLCVQPTSVSYRTCRKAFQLQLVPQEGAALGYGRCPLSCWRPAGARRRRHQSCSPHPRQNLQPRPRPRTQPAAG
jgi:hypothetical protein